MVKNIIFDFDGVIIDSYKELVAIFQGFDRSVTEKDILDCFNTAIDSSDSRSWQQPEFFEYLFREYSKRLSNKNIYFEAGNSLKKIKNDRCNFFLVTSNAERVV